MPPLRPAVNFDYLGETSNSIKERAAQHMKARTEDKEGHMRSHLAEAHPEVEVDVMDAFKIAHITPHTSAFARQIQEAYMIKNYKGIP